MKNLTRTITGLVGVAFFFISNMIVGQNNIIDLTPKPDFPSFSTLEISGFLQVQIEKGDTQAIWVETESKKDLKLEVIAKKGVLKISSGKSKNLDDIEIHVVYTQLNKIVQSGITILESEGSIQADRFELICSGAAETELDVNTNEMLAVLSGASDVELSGSAEKFILKASGAASVEADEFIAKYAEIETEGAAEADVFVTEEVEGVVSGASNLEVSGNPKVSNIDKSGSADISIPDIPDIVDSTSVNIGGLHIEVFENEDSVRVKIGNMTVIVDDEGNVKIDKRKKNHKFKGHWDGFELGINGYVNSENTLDLPAEYEFLELDMNKSWKVGINFLEQSVNLVGNQFGIVTGLGLQFINYRFDNDVVISGDSAQIFGFHSTNFDYDKSKLVVNYLVAPLLFEFQTRQSNNFHLAAGGIFGLRIGSHTKRLYFEDGGRKTPKTRDDFHLNPLKYEATVRVGWGSLTIYGTYTLSELFQKNRGPELYPFSVGIALGT